MKRWSRRRIRVKCGYCGLFIPAGDPLLELRFAEVQTVKIRCADCARHHGEQPPADLPALEPKPVRQPTPVARDVGMSRFSATPLPLDRKQKASGE